MNRALNCWEYMLCGREVGGSRVDEEGVCPAATDKRLTGIHKGKNGGRSCWVVAGSISKGIVECTFAGRGKYFCGQCDFYNFVKAEEGSKLLPTILLLKELEK